MDEPLYRVCDTLIKAIGLAVILVGLPAGIWQYRDTKQKEFYAELWKRRLDTYESASKAAASIATARSLEASEGVRQDFWRLFYGPMSLIEDDGVKTAMQTFGGLVRSVEGGNGSMRDLEQPAYQLTIALRDSLKSTWDRPFEFSQGAEVRR